MANHLSKMLHSEDHAVVISSAKQVFHWLSITFPEHSICSLLSEKKIIVNFKVTVQLDHSLNVYVIFPLFNRVLCQTVKDFVAKVGEAHEKEGQKDSDIALKVRRIKVRTCVHMY